MNLPLAQVQTHDSEEGETAGRGKLKRDRVRGSDTSQDTQAASGDNYVGVVEIKARCFVKTFAVLNETACLGVSRRREAPALIGDRKPSSFFFSNCQREGEGRGEG